MLVRKLLVSYPWRVDRSLLINSDFLYLNPIRYSQSQSCVVCFFHWGRLIGYFQGRHDDPVEIAQDEVRQQIRQGHRFLSFAGERSGVNVKW